ncbi:hypothetical protein LTR08_005409 [Meristemomyces frigidus]|nr:hypothetical protein LTR08_005409 [Meristemomyces frigidus]
MFGLILSGRPVDARPQTITATQFAFQIPPTPPFTHIVVFLLPGVQLPPDAAATVYVQLPPSPEFKLLGAIGPGKESAIFKISGLGASVPQGDGGGGGDGDVDAMTDDSFTPAPNPNGAAPATAGSNIIVGLSIEPTAQVEAQLATLKSAQQPTPPSSALVRTGGAQATTKVLAQRIIGNAFNFLASFGSEVVPLKAFQEWWVKFEKKVELDPGFLEREAEGG